MKRIFISAICIISLISCQQDNTKSSTNNLNSKTETMEKVEKKKIEELLNEYKKALNSSDAELATSLYTKDGIFMPTEAPSAIGANNILKSYQFIFSQIQLSIEFFIEEIQIENNMAFAVTSSKGSVKIQATGDSVPEANRELFVFEKINNEWKIARYMFNKTEVKK